MPPLRFPEFSGEWERKTLGDIGSTYSGLTGKSGSDFGSGYPYIPYKTIFDNSRVDLSKVEYVSISEDERQNRVIKGDIFFTTSSETPEEVGMTSVILDTPGRCYLNSFCFGYRLNNANKYLAEYFRFYLRCQQTRRKLAILAQGSTRFNISKNEVMGMLIYAPEVIEQKKIATFMSLLEERIATQRKIIDKLETLIRGLCLELTQQEEPNTCINQCLKCYSSILQEGSVRSTGKYPVYGAVGVCGFTDKPEVDDDSILIIKDGASVGTTYYAAGRFSFIGTLNRLVARQGRYSGPYPFTFRR